MLTSKTFGITFNSVLDNLQSIKEQYCPSGHTCNDIMSIGGLLFVFWFMYIAMEPII